MTKPATLNTPTSELGIVFEPIASAIYYPQSLGVNFAKWVDWLCMVKKRKKKKKNFFYKTLHF